MKSTHDGVKIRIPKSLPVRERGLKCFHDIRTVLLYRSLPVRERGLKFGACRLIVWHPAVAPRAGAWIEIFNVFIISVIEFVAPRAGAWIEIVRFR